MKRIERKYATGAAALAFTHALPSGSLEVKKVLSVTLHFSAAPTTSQNLTIVLDSGLGAAYDTTLYSVNPSTSAMTDLFWQPSEDFYILDGDTLKVNYTNTDTRTYGLTVLLEVV